MSTKYTPINEIIDTNFSVNNSINKTILFDPKTITNNEMREYDPPAFIAFSLLGSYTFILFILICVFGHRDIDEAYDVRRDLGNLIFAGSVSQVIFLSCLVRLLLYISTHTLYVGPTTDPVKLRRRVIIYTILIAALISFITTLSLSIMCFELMCLKHCYFTQSRLYVMVLIFIHVMFFILGVIMLYTFLYTLCAICLPETCFNKLTYYKDLFINNLYNRYSN